MNELFTLLAPLVKDWKPAEFAQNLTLFSVAWWVVKQTVNKHFKSIEEKLERISLSMVRLEQTLSSVEASHGERITKVEMDVKKLSTRVIREEN